MNREEFCEVPKQEGTLFFWSVVQTIRDYVEYNPDRRKPGLPFKAFDFAKKWINGHVEKAQWGESDLEISFPEALEMMGIAPENVSVIKDVINKAAGKKPEWEAILRCMDLHWHDNEPLSHSWIGTSFRGLRVFDPSRE